MKHRSSTVRGGIDYGPVDSDGICMTELPGTPWVDESAPWSSVAPGWADAATWSAVLAPFTETAR